MPHTVSTVRSTPRQIGLARGEDVLAALRRIDRAELDAVRRHLLGDLGGSGGSGGSGDHADLGSSA